MSKKSPMFRLGALLVSLSFVSALHATNVVEMPNRVIVSVHDQKLMLLQNGARVATYPISTSKFGVGDITGRGSIEFWTQAKKMTTKWNKEAGTNWMS